MRQLGRILERRFVPVFIGLLILPGIARSSDERELRLSDIPEDIHALAIEVGDSGEFTWWLPAGAEQLVLPICAGVVVDTSSVGQMKWVRRGSPWSLRQLPALGVRYGDGMVVVIVPWPHYAELVVEDRVGIRFAFPEGRHLASPCEIVTMRRGPNPLEVAHGFREWRAGAESIGVIPRQRTLKSKIADLKNVERLLGAPHCYLWGPALFSRHDLPRGKWLAFAKALRDAPPGSFGDKLAGTFSNEQWDALDELAGAEWPMNYLTVTIADAIDRAMSDPDLLGLDPDVAVPDVVSRNRLALAEEFPGIFNPIDSWGDGLSHTVLDGLHEAGLERALLILSDLYGRSPRPDVAARADRLGYLLGPYDSYHSVHSPDAEPDETWETAQFDCTAFEKGRILYPDGTGHGGFKGRGFHFAPQAAWPHVRKRVGGLVRVAPYSTWFVDCDATAECFDDFSPEHSATRLDDTRLRRGRLSWLESKHGMVVGSEGGSVLFSDVIHYGHGVHTPYIGHLDPGFRDRESPHFLGRYWPPDTPEQSFEPVPVPSSVRSPYFDPAVRIPLYQAVLGDELIATHHWSFDSLKFSDVAGTRELREILYQVPPMYHLNRETWPERKDRILRHLAFWGPIHRQLATAQLTDFRWLSEDHLVQETTFRTEKGEVTITVNFSDREQSGFPPRSATVAGDIEIETPVYFAASSFKTRSSTEFR